jgi:hypothetical protein
MRTILFKIVIVVILVLLALKGLSFVYSFGIKHNCNSKASYIQSNKINADILIHGPCEPLWMMQPKAISSITGLSTYNLALSHSDFADNYLHLYFYLKYNKAPKYLFLYVTPESMDTNYNVFNTYRFAAYLNDSVVKNVVNECDINYGKWSKIPFMNYAYYNSKINFEVLQGIKHYWQQRQLPHFADGYEPPFNLVWDNHLEKFRKLYPKGYYFNWNSLREKYLLRCIQLCKQNNIQLYLYESPVLAEAIIDQPNRTEIINRIKLLADKNKVGFLMFDKMAIAQSRDYFMSTLNLNLKGAQLFNDTFSYFLKTNIIK